MNQKITYFVFLRGIAIMMVVAIHTFPRVPFDGIFNILQVLIRQIVGCPVPLFLALSGFFLGKKTLESKEQRLIFWKNQISKVYIPALIWSLPFFALSLKNGSPLLSSSVNLFLMGYSIYYFIALIIQCYLLIPFLQKIDFRQWGGVIFFVSITCGFFVAWLGANGLPLILYAGPCVTWLVFFCLGIYLGRNERNYRIKPLIVGLLFSIILMIIESYILDSFGKSGYGLKPSVYIYSLFVILILFSKKLQDAFDEELLINKCISYIGKISFGIYLIHYYLIMIIAILPIEHIWIVRWLSAMLMTVLTIKVAEKILPNKILKYIGFV